ncbi:MAG: crossover junction endodeoxyribonuclease RuvC [Sedimentisphaerales bacterium]|nr:crossover junction endodeoxyribonuclease RuvC [Sedimentisphaerales bacterium]
MRILGIDPGLLACGYGCLAVTHRPCLVEAGLIRIKGRLDLPGRLCRIADDLDQILDSLQPDIVAVEQLYAHYAHPRTAILMGHARGVILYRCAARSIKVLNFNPTRIKKSVTGNGHASKLQIQRAIQKSLHLEELPSPPDVADAIAVALCCADTISRASLTTIRT